MDIRPLSKIPGPNGDDITIAELLGQGGFGQVFAGTTDSGIRVAVKTMLTGILSSGELETLLNEGQLAVGISHPNVVRVLHFSDGKDGSGIPPYLVMERIDGGPLSDLLEARKVAGNHFSDDELNEMFSAIAAGMEAVNERLVHRDLKPSNVLIESSSGLLKICDFGLAKLASAATRRETFKGWGTPPYMAPEAWEDKANTPAMDIYAAGVMFFQLATLQFPIEPRSGDAPALAWRNAHLLVQPKSARAIRPSISDDHWQLLTKMLQKDPRKRPGSWAEVKATLTRKSPASSPDVSALVRRAIEATEEAERVASARRAAAEAEDERRAILEATYEEPLAILEALVHAFNQASDLVKLDMVRDDRRHAIVSRRDKRHDRPALTVSFQQIDDLPVQTRGVYRVLGTVSLSPEPNPRERSDFFKNDTFGGFNLAYRVRSPGERYGDWEQLRFEMSPFSTEMRFPHWWAHTLSALPRELQLLNASHVYQHQKGPLDQQWFSELLTHLL